MENGFWTTRRWLARLSFSFLIVGLWLLWIAYKATQNHTLSQARLMLCYVSAGLSFSLFLAGTREKHRSREE